MGGLKKLKASPGMARRLLTLAQYNGLVFDESIESLALTDLLDPESLDDSPWTLDPPQISALQHVRDWEGRAMLLCNSTEKAREVALTSAWLHGGKTLILSQSRHFGEWADLARRTWPDHIISVFGNPRYHDRDQILPEGIEFSDRPNMEANILITSYGGLVWHDIVGAAKVDQAIVEELDHSGAINYRWEDAVQGMFHEIPRPLFIQNVASLPKDEGRGNPAALQFKGSKGISFIASMIRDYMWPGTSHLMGMTDGSMYADIDAYLARRYSGMDNLKKLTLFGVSSHLLDDDQGGPLVVFDDAMKRLKAISTQADGGIHRITERERALEESMGLELSEIARRALAGDRASQDNLRGLWNQQWAALKAQHVRQVHEGLANRTTKCLFVSRHPDVRRSLSLHLGTQASLLGREDDRVALARFAYPHRYELNPQDITRPLSSLIVTMDDLIARPDLLQFCSFLFLVDPPLDPSDYQDIRELTEATGSRLVSCVMRGTVEEHIANIIAKRS